MGFFNRNKKQEDRLEQADRALNKGISGLFIKGLIPKEQREQMQAGVNAAKQAQSAASGQIPVTATATVLSVTDTGKLVNFDPMVVLVLDVTEQSGAHYQKTLETLVSKMQVPRPGDRVALGQHPSDPASFIYMGPLV